MNFGVIGTSWITTAYVKGAIGNGNWNLNAVYSRKLETGKAFAKEFECENVFTDIQKMAESDLFEAVYIASPNSFHYEHCKLFLQNNKHVISEKPLVTELWQAEELFELAEKNNLIFMEAIMFMHLPQRKNLENAMNKIGDITMATFDFCQRSSKYDQFLSGQIPNIFNPEFHTGSLMDLGVYCIYPALYFWGEPKGYNVNLRKLNTNVDGSGLINLDYDSMQVSIKFSKIGQTGSGSDIQGNNGTIYIDSISKLTDMKIIYSNKTQEIIGGDIEKEILMSYEAESFYKYINNEKLDEYQSCKKYSLLVMKYLQEFRKIADLPF